MTEFLAHAVSCPLDLLKMVPNFPFHILIESLKARLDLMTSCRGECQDLQDPGLAR
jgi:hypothetical protein